METIRDRSVIGALAGTAAILTRDIYSFLTKAVGFAKFYVWSIAADLFVSPKEVRTAMGTILGILADAALGGLLGVLFVHFLHRTGGKSPLAKGLGVGLGAWLFLFGVMLHNLPQTEGAAPADALSNLSAFIGHCLFGLALAYYTGKLLRFLDVPP